MYSVAIKLGLPKPSCALDKLVGNEIPSHRAAGERSLRTASRKQICNRDRLAAKVHIRTRHDVVDPFQRIQAPLGDLDSLPELFDVEVVLKRKRDRILKRQRLNLTVLDADTLPGDFR